MLLTHHLNTVKQFDALTRVLAYGTSPCIGLMEQQRATPRKPAWQKTPTPNLVRYTASGIYYMRARFGGEAIRETLKTANYRIAQVRLAKRIEELRQAIKCEDGVETLLDAVRVVRRGVENDPSLKQSTRCSYLEQLDSMEPGKPAAVPAVELHRLRSSDLEPWWKATAAAYAPQRANHQLMFLKRAIAIGKKSGAVRGNPAASLKRVKIPGTVIKSLTSEEFRSVVASIRKQRKANSDDAANWVEFMAYSGMRPAEIDALLWGDVDAGSGIITVRGGTEGTKNREVRRVPIIPPMHDLLRRMFRRKSRDPVFPIGKPKDALRNACERLGIQRLRIYDLRHLFASMCNAAGVDVPTFSRWLGHKDGGALAMRVYVHPHEEHGKKQAEKVTYQ